MNIVIDSGNTRFKVGLFEGNALREKFSFANPEELFSFLNHHHAEAVLISAVRFSATELADRVHASKKFILTHSLPVPLTNHYQTPETLGVDRLAAACGLAEIFPNRAALAIDAGTCITYELVDEKGAYLGGAIAPGLTMKLKAMHTFTERLPLVELTYEAPLVGGSTKACMLSGVLNGTAAEVDGMIEKYREHHPGLGVALCGGDSFFFEKNLKQPIFAAPELVLMGLNRILIHNASL